MNTHQEDSDSVAEGPKTLKFSTRSLPVAERVRLWEGHNSRALIPLDIRTLDDSPMKARQENLVLPGIRLADVTGTSQIVERTEAFIKQNPTGAVAVFFALEGDAYFLHRDGMINIKPGQAVVYHGDRPFSRGWPRGLRELVLTIPEVDFLEAFGVSIDKLPLVIDFAASAGASEKALPRLLSKTLRTESLDPAAVVAAEEELMGLLSRVLTASNSSSAGLVAAAKDVIERSYADTSLSTAEVAMAVGISERQLARAFADYGTSLGSYLRSRRVSMAQTIMRDPRFAAISMSEVAARCGFSSSSVFSRAFKDEVGLSPLQWRKQG